MASNTRNVNRRRNLLSACFYFVLGGVSFAAFLCSAFFVGSIQTLIERELHTEIPTFCGALPLGVFLMVAGIAWRRGRQYLARSADEAMERDPRDPIVLLRAFRMDEISVKSHLFLTRFRQSLRLSEPPPSLEELLSKVFARWGPIVALGRPGEPLPPLGFARTYVDGNSTSWKSDVQHLIKSSRMIIVIIGTGVSLAWELRQIAHLGAVRKVLFVFPPVSASRLKTIWSTFSGSVSEVREFGFSSHAPSKPLFATVPEPGNFQIVGDYRVGFWNKPSTKDYRRGLKDVSARGGPLSEILYPTGVS